MSQSPFEATPPPKMGGVETPPTPVSSQQIRSTLAAVKEETGVSVDCAQADRVAATLRDALLQHDGDPGNKDQIFGAMVISWCSLKVSMLLPLQGIVGPLWVQTEVLRRMVDGEIPILSAEEMLGLSNLSNLASPEAQTDC